MGPAILLMAMAGAAAQNKPAVAPAPPPPPPVRIPAARPASELPGKWLPQIDRSKPQPINPARWISNADYPAAAIRAGAKGQVGIRLGVNAVGRVSECLVQSSSGNADLDAAACRLMVQRGRFNPALDDRGEPTAGNYETHVRWDLSDLLRPLPKEGDLVITLTVAPNGSVSDCSFIAKGAATAEAPDPCKTIRFAPTTLPDAKSRRLRLTTRVEYLDPQ